MKRWGYGINSYHKTATIYCEVAPFYIFWLESIISTICGYLIPAIPFLKIPLRLKDDELEWNDGKRWTTWKDWYGDLSQWFHVQVDMTIFDFCNKFQKHYSINVPYHKLRKSFYEMGKDFFDEEEQRAKEIRQEEEKDEGC
ncbi:hypothetical protein ES703_104639 [subsurface metagenome]